MERKWIVGVVALAVGIALAGTFASAARTARKAKITTASGSVEWQRAGSPEWQVAFKDQELSNGDKLRTAEDSQAILSLDDGSTIELTSASELSVVALSKDSNTERQESIFGIWKGGLIAKIAPFVEGSTFQFETATTNINIPAAAADPTVTVTINPDGSVSVKSDEGTVELVREGDNHMYLQLETGEEALVEHDPGTGVLRVTSLLGTFEVIGPDNVPITLADGDTVIYSGGADTYIPGVPPVDAPVVETIGEPVT